MKTAIVLKKLTARFEKNSTKFQYTQLYTDFLGPRSPFSARRFGCEGSRTPGISHDTKIEKLSGLATALPEVMRVRQISRKFVFLGLFLENSPFAVFFVAFFRPERI